MCVAFWTLDHPKYALILCSNRDEFLDRPTENAHFHAFHRQDLSNTPILSGIDDQAGGTWLGVNRENGRIALLTNITEPRTKLTSSRGELVSSFLLPPPGALLLRGGHPASFVYAFPKGTQYAGFNLLLLSPISLSASSGVSTQPTEFSFEAALMTNSGAGGPITSRPLTPSERACGGLSNGVDGKGGEDWPKVRNGRDAFAAVLDSAPAASSGASGDDRRQGQRNEDKEEEELVDQLFDVLSIRSAKSVTERSHLRETIHVTPLPVSPLDTGEPGSGTKTAGTWYATRLSTVLLVRRDTGEACFVERDVWRLGADDDGRLKPIRVEGREGRRVFRFPLGQAAEAASQ